MTAINQKINEFSKEYRSRTINFLKHNYPDMQECDCEDIFQDSIIILCRKLSEGEIIRCSLYTYFVKICILTAKNYCRKLQKMPILKEEITEKEFIDSKIDYLIGMDSDNEDIKSKLVTEFVETISEPCKTILKACYWENLKLKTIAEMQNKKEGAIKTSKSRCLKNYRYKFQEIIKHLNGN